MSSLLDVNVLLAIVHAEHEHSSEANLWLDVQTANGSIHVCRVAQMGLLRLLARKVVMGEKLLSSREAWGIWSDLIQDDRITFSQEPTGFESEWRRVSENLPDAASVNTDSYFAAFAQAAGLTLVTFDQGFSRFPDLKIEILRQS